VGSYDFTAGANTSESDEAATADFGYTGNRYLLQADHEARSDQNDSGITEQVSGVTFQSAVAYSGGQMAVGRPSNGAFAIVAPHKTLTNNKIAVDVNENNLPLATTDVFGPALVPNLRTYSPSRLPVQIDDLPTGYDLGSGRYDLNPGARTGYDLQVGSANSVVIIGRLVRPDGTHYTLASGIITPEEGQPTSFFTNRSGRFVGEKLAPGKHTLTLYTDPPVSTTFVIPEDAVGRVELGNLIPMP
jgi:outer membrane usher protein